MKMTRIIFHLITILALLGALGLGAVAVQNELHALTFESISEALPFVAAFQHYGTLAVGAVLIAILSQIVLIVVKMMSKQDVKREWQVAALIIAMLIFVPVAVWAALTEKPHVILVMIMLFVVALTRRW